MKQIKTFDAKMFRQCRLDFGLNQVQLATELGISKALVSSYERAVSKPCLEKAIMIARFFGLSEKELFTRIEKKSLSLSKNKIDCGLLIKLRESTGLNISKTADKIGVSKSTLSFWESGKSNPTVFNRQCLADYYGVTVEYLEGF